MREPLDMHAEGFDQPDDSHPIAGLVADFPPVPVTRQATRTSLMVALRQTPQHQHLHREALGALAEEILARLPVASPDARDAEISRVARPLVDELEAALREIITLKRELAAALARLRELTGPLPGDPGWSLDASGDGPPSLADPMFGAVNEPLLPRMKRERDEARAERDAAKAQLAILTKGDT